MGAAADDANPPVNPLMRAILGLFAAPRINMREDYELVRRAQRALSWVPRDPDRILDRSVTAQAGHEIPLRIFLPKTRMGEGMLLFFHGGGWTIGDIDTYSATCRTMAELTGRVVCSVGYRLAPEHPYPAALEDCLDVAETLLANPALAGAAGPEDITLVGDSAGGNLVAAVTLALRGRGGPLPGAQILFYPVTQWDHDPATSPYQSVADYGTGLRLTAAEVQDYVAMYQPDPELRLSPLMSPLLAEDLSGLPPALVVTAEYDLLRDEGEAFGHALRAAGTPARIERIDGALHGFIGLPRLSRPVARAYQIVTDFLDGALADSRPLPSPSARRRA
ncbi:MAG TPA: alpha/beta hydrolase [Propionibacterium sp.]|nr:alpha/beta hydrolase [Propionibacterium sp.]